MLRRIFHRICMKVYSSKEYAIYNEKKTRQKELTYDRIDRTSP